MVVKIYPFILCATCVADYILPSSFKLRANTFPNISDNGFNNNQISSIKLHYHDSN